MKYIALFVLAIVLIKIDVIISLGEKSVMLFKSEKTELTQNDQGNSPVIVRSQKIMELTPRERYLSLMDNFRVSPDAIYREQAMELFRQHPQMFSDKRDKGLEGRMYSWRDLVVQNPDELPLFLNDLNNILKGENKVIVTRFYSVVLDLNLEMFMTSYPRTKDIACTPVLLLEEAVPPEEKFPELYERLNSLQSFLSRENLPADKKNYASICVNSLKIYLEKEAPPVPPEETSPAEESPAPAEATIPESNSP